jgi:GntR family transcriptional regulator
MIDREGPRPVYVQIADVIAARIRSGQYPVDRPIPSEIHLQQEFEVARDTIRAAVGLLRDRKLVHTVRGKGTYVGQPSE